jgi:hypothetical protein
LIENFRRLATFELSILNFLGIKPLLYTSCEAEGVGEWRPHVCFQNIKAFFLNGGVERPEAASQN